MPQVNHKINFKYGTYDQYASITPDPNTVYFCYDSNEIYVGTTPYTAPVLVGDSPPTASLAAAVPYNTLYYDRTNSKLYTKTTVRTWLAIATNFSLPYTPIDSAEKGAANGVATLDANSKLPTAQLPGATRLSNNTDLDTVLTEGNYYSTSDVTVTNAPTGITYFNLEVIRTSTNAWNQVLSSTSHIYTRYYVEASGSTPAYWTNWVEITNITKSTIGLGNVENKSSSTIRSEMTSSDVTTALGFTPTSAYSGTSPISVNNTTKVISHSTSGVTAGSKGDTTNQTPAFGGTFKVPSGTVDANGHLTNFADHTVKIPAETSVSFSSDLYEDPLTLDYGNSFTVVSNVTRDTSSTSHAIQRTKRVYTLPSAPVIPSGAYYGTCVENYADQAEKVISISSDQHLQLKKGTIIGVYFSATNTFNATLQSPITFKFGSSAESSYRVVLNNMTATGTNPLVFGYANRLTYYMVYSTDSKLLMWMGTGCPYSAGTGITISDNLRVSVDTSRIATKTYADSAKATWTVIS